jgi:hypothetical protein
MARLRIKTIKEALESQHSCCATCQERQAQPMLHRSYEALVPWENNLRIPGKYGNTWQYYRCSNCKDIWLCQWDAGAAPPERSLFRVQCNWDLAEKDLEKSEV